MNSQYAIRMTAITFILLAALMPQGLSQASDLDVLYDSGTFVIEVAGQKIGVETFAIQPTPSGGFTLVSASAIINNTQSFQVLALDGAFRPLRYVLQKESSTASPTRVSATIEPAVATISIESGGNVQQETIVSEYEFVMFDNAVASQSLIIWAQIVPNAEVGQEYSALIPQAFGATPLTIEAQTRTTLRSDGALVEVDELSLAFELSSTQEDQEAVVGIIRLFSSNNHFLGVLQEPHAFSPETKFYRAELFPSGFEVINE